MTTGYVALAVEGFQLTGTPIRDEVRVRQSIQSIETGVTYCFYSLGVREVQQQFDRWFADFVVAREAFHRARFAETIERLKPYARNAAPIQNRTSSRKD